jgi:hypothetical protein
MSEFSNGIRTIRKAIEAELKAEGVRYTALSDNVRGSAPNDTDFSVAAFDRTHTVTFNRQEIEDSERALDSFAHTKIRMLVSHFTIERDNRR